MSDWVEAAKVSDFSSTDRKLVSLGGGRECVVFESDGEFFAVTPWCSHERSSLVDGEVYGGQVECPHHGARFDLRTGQPLTLPAVRPIARYDVKIEGDRILVRF